MNSFMKIAATFVLSSPLALVGCMGDVDDTEQSESMAQELGAGDAQFTSSSKSGGESGDEADHSKKNLVAVPCLVPPISCPNYSAPVISAPTYPAPRFEAPKHEAPVYKAPAYQLPTYQLPGEVPNTQAPRYEAPTYPGPTYQAPVYEAPVYEAPSFPAPIFERATYLECRMLQPWQLAPCAVPVIPISPERGEGQSLSHGGEDGQALMPGGE